MALVTTIDGLTFLLRRPGGETLGVQYNGFHKKVEPELVD